MSDINLLPCPCCGATAITGKDAEYENSNGEPAVECSACNVMSWTADDWNRRAAVEAGRQRRTPSDEEIEKLAREFDTSGPLEGDPTGFDHVGFARALLSRYSSGQPAASAEPLVRFCPGCGSIGPVPEQYRDCCPDGSDARMIPQSLAEKCRDTFRVAVKVLTAEAEAKFHAQSAAPVAQEPVAWVRPDLVVDGKIQATSFTAHTNYRDGYAPLSLAAPVAAQAQPTMPPLTEAMRAVLRNGNDVYGDEDALYAALCDAAPLNHFPDATKMVQSSGNATLDAMERALTELVDKIVPGLDTGDLVADATTASKALDRAQPSGNAGELPAVPDGMEQLAVNRYRPVPSGVIAYKVVCGDGERSLFSGTKDECYIVARKLTEAFLDGAHVALAAQAQPVVNQSTEREAFEFWASDEGEYPTAVERDGNGNYKLAQIQSHWEAWQARAALAQQPSGQQSGNSGELSAQDQEDAAPVAYLTRTEDGDPAMLFFDRAEAETYCADDVQPEPLYAARAAKEQT